MAKDIEKKSFKEIKMRIGIVSPSEIAFRRFMPALEKIENVEFAGVAIADLTEREGYEKNKITAVIEKSHNKAKKFVELYGGKIYYSYRELINSKDIDAVYIPLPPALHYKWAKLALENNKHVLIEKPSTISYLETYELVELARKNKRALHENYMFTFHNQITAIEKLLEAGTIGKIRLYRIYFGFPKRSSDDFRYNRELGGGALLDAGGYTIKYAKRILGDTAKIVYAQMNYEEDAEVDIYGSGAMVNDKGSVVQFAYGMDNSYKCELEVWGSKGCLNTGRILTAPDNFEPEIFIKIENDLQVKKVDADDAFKKSILYFMGCIEKESERDREYNEILTQANLITEFRKKAQEDMV